MRLRGLLAGALLGAALLGAALLGTALAGGAATGAAGLVDVGRSSAKPAALIVPSPGLAPAAFEDLTRRLERRGWDAWRLDLERAAPDPVNAATRAVPDAIRALRVAGRSVLVVGEGWGGRVAARSVAAGQAQPDALALLGVPLDLQPSGDQPFELISWLAARPVPGGEGAADTVDLRKLRAARWRQYKVLPLLLGDPLPPLQPVSSAWLRAMADEVWASPRVSLEGVTLPMWAAASPADNLAPPEAMRGQLGSATFVRLGYLNLDSREPDHAGLLTDPAPTRALLAWARRLDLD